MRTLSFALTALLVLALSPSITAQGAITDGNARWEYNTVTNGSADFQPDGGLDTFFRQWFWWRVDGDPSETILSGPTSEDYVADTATLGFSEVLFDVQVVNVITDDPAPETAFMAQTIDITNTTTADLVMNFFVFSDIDSNGAGGDSAEFDGDMTIRVVDTGGQTVLFQGVDATNYRVTPYNQVMNSLDDAVIDNFADTGLPFASGDFVGGFQWNLAIGALETVTVEVNYGTGPAGVTLPTGTGGAPEFARGDVNGDGVFDISDTVFTLAALFIPGSESSSCNDAADVNDDGATDVSDAVYALASLFIPSSPAPPAPGASTCGEDPTADSLDCVEYDLCP